MDLYLMSILGASYKDENGVRKAKRVIDENGLESQLKKSIKKIDKLVFVASDPAGYIKTDEYANLTAEGLAMSGMKFKEVIVLDNRTKADAKEIIENADFVFLTGGHVPTQNKFFEEINLKGLLKNFKGVVAGQSAGAMNLAEDVVNYPEEVSELKDPMFLKGLGLTTINVIPHFEPMKGNEQVDDEIDLLSIFNDYSKKYSLVCLENGSHIKISNGAAKVYGEAYLIENQKMTKICENGKSFEINEKNKVL